MRLPTDPLVAALRDCLLSLLDRDTSAAGPGGARPDVAGPTVPLLLVAFSGGLDSTVLLAALAACWPPARLHAIHVHHGLMPSADDWAAHCAGQCSRLGVALTVERLDPAQVPPANIEQWAREARYDRLVAQARRLGAAAIVTAHHEDDQAETLLLRLARGAGPRGLAGIRAASHRDGVLLVRPLLDQPRAQLLAFGIRHQLAWVQDPSNTDNRFTRNALRNRVMPVFEQVVPGVRRSLARAAALWSDAAALLDEMAQADLARACSDDQGLAVLDRGVLRELTAPRRAWVLRAWFERHSLQMPSRAQTLQWLAQMVDGQGASAQMVLQDHAFLRFRDQVFLLPQAADGLAGLRRAARVGPLPLGSPRSRTADGLEQAWLLPAGLGLLRLQAGGPDAGAMPENLSVSSGDLTSPMVRTVADRPARSLKNLYQERGVPSWLRCRYPLLWLHGQPVWSAAFGALAAPAGLRFDWSPEPAPPAWQALVLRYSGPILL